MHYPAAINSHLKYIQLKSNYHMLFIA